MRSSFRIVFTAGTLAVLGAAACGSTPSAETSSTDAAPSATTTGDAAPVPTADDLGPVLEPLRATSGVPGLSAAVYRGGKALARGAVGTRKQGDAIPITNTDVWHLGSDTKAMTATLAAILVEEKKLDWKTPILELLPDLPMDPGFAKVTFEELLFHRAGLPASLPTSWMQSARNSKDFVASRKDLARELLLAKPSQAPGTYVYSNAGYIVAGAILESIAKDSWENVLKARLFDKLGMTTCGYGPPAAVGETNQPWGHSGGTGAYKPVAPGPLADNPLPLGPAGTVHCSLDDWAKFTHAHARGEKEGGLVSKESFVKLHTAPAGGDYAMGWVLAPRSWSGGVALTHVGSNTMFMATAWIAPAKDLVFLVVTNAADEAASRASDDAIGALVETYAK